MSEIVWNAERVRQLRAATGWTQKEFGIACGLAPSGAQTLVSKWEHSGAPDRQKGNLEMINQNAGFPIQPPGNPVQPPGVSVTPAPPPPVQPPGQPASQAVPQPDAKAEGKRQRKAKMQFPTFDAQKILLLRQALNIEPEQLAVLMGQRSSYGDTIRKLENGETKINSIQQLAFNYVLSCAMGKWPDGAQAGEIDPLVDYIEVMQLPYGGEDYLLNGALPNNTPLVTEAEWVEAAPHIVTGDANWAAPTQHSLGGPAMPNTPFAAPAQQIAPEPPMQQPVYQTQQPAITAMPPSPTPPSAQPAGYVTPDLSWAEQRLTQATHDLPVHQPPQQATHPQQAVTGAYQQPAYQQPQAPAQPVMAPPPPPPPVVPTGRVFTPNVVAFLEASGLPMAAADAYLSIEGREAWVSNSAVTAIDIATDFNQCRQAGLC